MASSILFDVDPIIASSECNPITVFSLQTPLQGTCTLRLFRIFHSRRRPLPLIRTFTRAMSSSPFVFNATAVHANQTDLPGSHTGFCSLNPQQWSVYPANGDTTQCPSAHSILTTFGLVNLAVTVLSLILGKRKITHLLTCRIFGKEKKNEWGRRKYGVPIPKSVLYMWTLPFTLQIIANAINAGIMKSTPNYSDASFSIGQVMVLYLMRPRITWLLGIIVLKFYPPAVCTGPEAVELGPEAVKTGPGAVITEEIVTTGPSGGTFGFLFVEEWQSWAYSQLIAEFMLQLMTSIIEAALEGCMSSAYSSLASTYIGNVLGTFPIIYVLLIFGFSLGSFFARGNGGARKVKNRATLKSLAYQLPFLLALMFAGMLWAERWGFWVYYLHDYTNFG
jgi:hypothetical protein